MDLHDFDVFYIAISMKPMTCSTHVYPFIYHHIGFLCKTLACRLHPPSWGCYPPQKAMAESWSIGFQPLWRNPTKKLEKLGDTDKQDSCCGGSKEILLEKILAPVEEVVVYSVIHSMLYPFFGCCIQHLRRSDQISSYQFYLKMKSSQPSSLSKCFLYH